MIKRSFVTVGMAAAVLLSVAPAATSAEIPVGPWIVQVPDVAPVIVPIPFGSEAGALPPLPFPFVWDRPVVPVPAPGPLPAPVPAPAPVAAPAPAPAPAPVAAPAPRQAPSPTYVANCTEARRLGIDPIYRGDAAYRPALDRDNDGVACE